MVGAEYVVGPRVVAMSGECEYMIVAVGGGDSGMRTVLRSVYGEAP